MESLKEMTTATVGRIARSHETVLRACVACACVWREKTRYNSETMPAPVAEQRLTTKEAQVTNYSASIADLWADTSGMRAMESALLTKSEQKGKKTLAKRKEGSLTEEEHSPCVCSKTPKLKTLARTTHLRPSIITSLADLVEAYADTRGRCTMRSAHKERAEGKMARRKCSKLPKLKKLWQEQPISGYRPTSFSTVDLVDEQADTPIAESALLTNTQAKNTQAKKESAKPNQEDGHLRPSTSASIADLVEAKADTRGRCTKEGNV